MTINDLLILLLPTITHPDIMPIRRSSLLNSVRFVPIT